MSSLPEITTALIFGYFLVFCRIGAGVMAMPGIGENYINVHARLLLSLVLSAAIYPVVKEGLPPVPGNVLSFFLLILIEIMVGVFLGLIVRILMTAMHTAGMIVATQAGLASAVLFDPNTGSQGAAMGNFMTTVAITLFFVLDLHHLLFAGVVDSYSLFLPGQWLLFGDVTNMVVNAASQTFFIAVKIAAPQIVVGWLLYLVAGIMSRLMPSMQVFFVLMPLQILVSLFVLLTTFSVAMMWYMNHITEALGRFIAF